MNKEKELAVIETIREKINSKRVLGQSNYITFKDLVLLLDETRMEVKNNGE